MSKQKKILGFVALSIAMFMGMIDSTIVNIALPDITNYFHANLNDTSWISTVYVMGLAVFTITASKLADQFGRKKVMIIGLVLFGGSSALCGMTDSLTGLILARLVQSIGGSIVTPLVIPMGLEIFGKEKMQPVAGAVGAVTALAAAGGPPVGGFLIKYVNWQAIFFVNVPFAIVSLLLIIFFVGESYDKSVSKKIDWLGMFLLTATLFLLTFALLKGNDYGWNSMTIVSMFIGAAVSLILFIVAEMKVKAPMVELKLFRETTFTASSICNLITGFGLASPMLIFSYFLQDALNYEPLKAALIIIGLSLTVIISMPLGTVLASKFGSRPVNFLGLVIMAAGIFSLTQLKTTTSDTIMILIMVLCGFGLGFASQAIVSAVKHLPQEKSGIGSGIVNASRQVGICIGIALLVSFLNGNVTAAANDIKTDAIAAVNQSAIVQPVKDVMVKDINDNIHSDTSGNSLQESDLQEKLQTDIENRITALYSTPRPSEEVLGQLYDAASDLNDGAQQIADGQMTLSDNLAKLDSGLGDLADGSVKLQTGLNDLDDGLGQALFGMKQLQSKGSKGLGDLQTGIASLNGGSQKLLSQFSSSGDASHPTVLDGVTGVASGAKALSSGLAAYVTAADSTFYLMIKNDPASPQLLLNYKTALAQAQDAYAKTTDPAAKAALMQQIQATVNLVCLYTAGTDTGVTTVQQFEAKLAAMAQQSADQQNVVASGAAINKGSADLTGASTAVAAQFKNGGDFYTGVQQLANGTETLYHSSGELNTLKHGFSDMTDALTQLKDGSAQLVSGSDDLQSGLDTAKSGTAQLLSGSDKLIDANTRLEDGTSKLESGVGLAGQKSAIDDVVNAIKADKDDKIAGAFDKTFLLAAIILMASSVFGLFTDKSEKKKSKQPNSFMAV